MYTVYVITNTQTGETFETSDFDTFADLVNVRDEQGERLYSIEYRTIYDS